MTRLIDADILKEAINTYDKFACLPDGKIYPFRELKHPEMFEPYIHFRDVIKAIDNAPTVIPEEMKPLIEKTIEILPQLTDKVLQSLCDTCRKYDECSDSTKISPNFYMSKCRKYEEADEDEL